MNGFMGENRIELERICKKRGEFSLADVSLCLPEGCILGLIGENGAGKSTLIKTLLGILPADSGRISLFGRPFDGSERRVFEKIGVVLDENQFPEVMTVSQVGKSLAGIFSGWDAARFDALCRRFGLLLGKPCGKLSKGTKMKLSIAAALSHGAELLVLDEPTSGLDPVVRDEFTDMLAEFAAEPGHAVLLSSHIVSDLEKVCDYIAFLHEGKLLLCEEKDRLKEKYGVLRCGTEEAEKWRRYAVSERQTPYGAELLCKRDAVPAGTPLGAVNIEDIFLFFSRKNESVQ